MFSFQNLKVERTNPGVMTVSFDMPGRPVNIFDESLLRELGRLIELLEQERGLSLVVFRSGKESGFFAGADVHRIQEIATAEEAEIVLNAGQQLFDRIASLPMPTMAVIHGPCLGGGLEFALSCTWRVAREDSSTRIGLPETQLGLIPGWGGTQRLPRLIGLAPALRMILEAQRLPASKARKLGLVDMAAPGERFAESVQAFLTDRLAGKTVRRPKRPVTWRFLENSRLGRWGILRMARKKLGRHAAHYPALTAALRAVEAGLRYGHARGLAAERREFCRALFSPACRRLMELFFLREKARKAATWSDPATDRPRSIRSIAVIGAGTMGAGIAQLAASQGFQLVLKDVNQELVDSGMSRIKSLMDEAVRKGAFTTDESQRQLRSITPATEWEAISPVDLVIEAVVERMEIKQKVFQELDQRLPADSLIVSNTSSLPIHEMAAATHRPAQVAGLHFFNPVHRMALVEVIQATDTNEQTIATLVELVRKLGKTPIVVRDAPGFLVNRILFPYLDEAARLKCEGVPTEEIDRAAERFGMPMGPLELLDQVGIDIAAEVARTMLPHSVEQSPSVECFSEMVSRGHLGRKSGAGFYNYSGGKKGHAVAEPRGTGAVKLPAPCQFENGETHDGITQRLILAMINEAAACLEYHIVREPWMVDLAMVLGTGFAPFRGGPLRLADSWGSAQVTAALDRLEASCGPRFRPCGLLREMAATERRFYNEADAHSQPSALAEAAHTS